MEREFVEINPQVWKPVNEGDATEGTFVKTKVEIGANKSKLHCFTHENGGEFSIWGSTILDDRMEYVKPGDFVRITYKKAEKNKRGQPVKIFKVEVARADASAA